MYARISATAFASWHGATFEVDEPVLPSSTAKWRWARKRCSLAAPVALASHHFANAQGRSWHEAGVFGTATSQSVY